MKKRILCAIMMLVLILTVCCIGSISAAADDDVAVIRAGDTAYTARVGDFIEYNIAFTYSGGNLTTGQVELPVDFSGLSCYTKSELSTHLKKIAPTTGASSVIERFEGDGTLGITGYVMNFVSPGGFSFKSKSNVLTLLLCVEKPGTYDLAAKVRYVDNVGGQTVVDQDYNILDARFSYEESVREATLETPQLKVATHAGGMMVTWNPVPGARLYRVYRLGSTWTGLVNTSATSYLDTNVKSGTKYTYTVRCLSTTDMHYISDYDRDGESAVYYTAPTLTLSNALDSVSIKWNATPGAYQYRVYRKNNGVWTGIVNTTGTSAVDKNVASGATYTYTIRALDKNGRYLSYYYPNGFAIQYVSAPDISLANIANGVRISWKAPAGAKNYRVYRMGTTWTKIGDTTATYFDDTNVTSNKTYQYTVRCINENATAYTSFFRNGKSIRYIAAPKLTLSSALDSVSLKWNAVPGAYQYRVYRKNNGVWTGFATTTGTSAVDKNVTSGTSYTYTIRALDKNGNYQSFYYTNGFTIQYVSAPEFSLANIANGVRISWKVPAGAKKFRVYRMGSTWTKIGDTTAAYFDDTNVTSNKTYQYTVRCINENATAYTSFFRSGKSITFYAAPKLTLSSTASGVSIKWNATPGAYQYRVYRKNGNSWAALVNTTGTSTVDKGVASGAKYTYTIRALDKNGRYLSYYYTNGFTITYQK